MTELEQLKSIRDNAKCAKGTTHVCLENGTNYQFKIQETNAEIFAGGKWIGYSGCALPDLVGVRNLSDINRIIELLEK